MTRAKTKSEQAAKGAYLSAAKLGKRLPDLEPVVLKSPYWATRYAWAVIEGRWSEAEKVIAKDAVAAAAYAQHVLRGRFPAGEKVIAKHASVACDYAAHVIRGRWRPGEAAMKRDPEILLRYAKQVLRGPLPEDLHVIMLARCGRNASARKYVTNRKYMGSAVRKNPYAESRDHVSDEYKAWARTANAALKACRTAKKAGRRMSGVEQTILKDPEATYIYARDVIKGRWAQGEKVLMRFPVIACLYAMNVIHGRFPAAEKAMAAHPSAALNYAAKALGARFPACEKMFSKDPFLAVQYAVRVVRGRWEPTEKILAEADPRTVYTYAKKVLKGPVTGKLHETMLAIRSADPSGFAERYAVEFGDTAAARKPRKKATKRVKS